MSVSVRLPSAGGHEILSCFRRILRSLRLSPPISHISHAHASQVGYSMCARFSPTGLFLWVLASGASPRSPFSDFTAGSHPSTKMRARALACACIRLTHVCCHYCGVSVLSRLCPMFSLGLVWGVRPAPTFTCLSWLHGDSLPLYGRTGVMVHGFVCLSYISLLSKPWALLRVHRRPALWHYAGLTSHPTTASRKLRAS